MSTSSSSASVRTIVSYLAIPSTEQTHADNFLVLRQLMHCCVLPKLNSAADDESVPVRLLLLFRDSGACMAPEIDLDIRHLAQYYGEIVSLVEHEWQILRFDPLIVPPSSCVRDSDGNDDDDAHFYLKQWEGCSAAHTELVLFSDSDKAEETAFCDDDDKYSHVERLKRESAEDYASYLEEIREVYPYYHHRHDHLIFERYGNVVLGGTFDRIHLGHKVMLSQLVMATKPSGTVHIGISGEPLLKNKKYREMIHPIEMRMDSVRRLIAVLKPCVNVNIFRIDEPVGPTATDGLLDAFVLSEEVVSVGHRINEMRKQNGLKPMDILIIPLVGPRKSIVKLSSTRLRELEHERQVARGSAKL